MKTKLGRNWYYKGTYLYLKQSTINDLIVQMHELGKIQSKLGYKDISSSLYIGSMSNVVTNLKRGKL